MVLSVLCLILPFFFWREKNNPTEVRSEGIRVFKTMTVQHGGLSYVWLFMIYIYVFLCVLPTYIGQTAYEIDSCK